MRPWTQKKFIVPGVDVRRRKAHLLVNTTFSALAPDIASRFRGVDSEQQLEECSLELVRVLKVAAKRAFRVTQANGRNRRPYRTRNYVRLGQFKRRVVRLLERVARGQGDHVPALVRSVAKDAKILLPDDPATFDLPPQASLGAWARNILRSTRREMKGSTARLKRVNWDAFVRNSELSTFANKIAKGSRPPSVTQVVDPSTGKLTEDPDVVKRQLLLRVTEPMRRPIEPPQKLDPSLDPTKPTLDGVPDWYWEAYTPLDVGDSWEGLLAPPTWGELRVVVGGAKKHTSPGEGALGIDLIQCCVDWRLPFLTISEDEPGPVAAAIMAYLAAVFRVGSYPGHLATAWITTIDKGSADPLDVRPISVLPELYRLVSRILNLRLLAVFRRRQILHPAQRAGLSDGDFLQPLDVVCAVLEDAKARDQGTLVMTLYDQSKAFDLVTPQAIRRACDRIKLPRKFQALVTSGMRKAKARVRTFYGLSEEINLVRSLRQGDPLSSLMYCIYIDPLHWMLEKVGGYQMKGLGVMVASQGFMDDTATCARDWAQAERQHRVVLEFGLLNGGKLNHKKSTMFLQDHEGDNETRQLPTEEGNIVPVDPRDPDTRDQRYLGLWINPDLGWEAMDGRLRRTFWRVFYLIRNNKMSLRAARLTINLWLLPPMNLALRLATYARHPARVEMLRGLQSTLNAMLAGLAGCPHPKNWKGAISPTLFGTKDMIQHSRGLNLEAAFLNLNLPPDKFMSAATALDRLASFFSASSDRADGETSHGPTNVEQVVQRLASAQPWEFSRGATGGFDIADKVGLALGEGLHFQRNVVHSNSTLFVHGLVPQSDFWSMLEADEGGWHPTVDLVRAALWGFPPAVWEVEAYQVEWIHDLIRLPAEVAEGMTLQVYTDGSAKPGEDSGAAAVFTFEGRRVLTVRTRLRGSPSSYLPECVGCLLAVKFAPLNVPIVVVSDCRSALSTVCKPVAAMSWRRRLTSAARPVLECSKEVLLHRDSPPVWRWVRSHTGRGDVNADAFFNDQADREAKRARGGSLSSNAPNRVWTWGAEKAILLTTEYPALGRVAERYKQPVQVMGSLKGFLARMQRCNLANQAAKTKTMGLALRYSGNAVLEVVRLLTRFATSKQHAHMAMALAFYLPLANRSTWRASRDPTLARCTWCWSGLKQDSPHLFACPRLRHILAPIVERQASKFEEALQNTTHEVRSEIELHLDQADFTRDCLCLSAIREQGDNWEGELPLTRDGLSAIPQNLLSLATSWARAGEWRSFEGLERPQSVDGIPNACVASAWKWWIAGLKLEARLADEAAPNAWNTAPPNTVWGALADPSLPKPFFAVVHEGTPALPPPSGLVWYTPTNGPRSGVWWALPLPLAGGQMRVFEWSPLASADAIGERAEWWAQAAGSSIDSVIWAVIPAESRVKWVTRSHQVECLESSPFWTQVVKPSATEAFWEEGRVHEVKAKCVLIFGRAATRRVHEEWANVIESLPSLLSSGGVQRLEGELGPSPAGWWWGPADVHLPAGPDREASSLAGRLPRAVRGCQGGRLCKATCGSRFRTSRFSRYLGNLGVPPDGVYAILKQDAPRVLAGDRFPAEWMANAWLAVGKLLGAGTRLR
jgi:hypothetical protein